VLFSYQLNESVKKSEITHSIAAQKHTLSSAQSGGSSSRDTHLDQSRFSLSAPPTREKREITNEGSARSSRFVQHELF